MTGQPGQNSDERMVKNMTAGIGHPEQDICGRANGAELPGQDLRVKGSRARHPRHYNRDRTTILNVEMPDLPDR